MFELDPESLAKLQALKPRVESFLDRDIDDEEDLIETFVEVMDRVESLKDRWNDSDLEQYG